MLCDLTVVWFYFICIYFTLYFYIEVTILLIRVFIPALTGVNNLKMVIDAKAVKSMLEAKVARDAN